MGVAKENPGCKKGVMNQDTDPIARLEPLIARLEAAAWRVARRRHGPVRQREIAQQVAEISRRYNRPEGEPLNLSPGLPGRMARLLFFTMADLPKVLLPLAELERAGRLPPGDAPLRVLDLGAGYGALTLGLLLHRAVRGERGPVSLLAMDQDAEALETLAALLEELRQEELLAGEVEVETRAASLNAPPSLDPPLDLVLAGGLINELPRRTEEDLARTALAALAPRGVLLLLEPALRHTSRRLHRLRDSLLASGEATLLAPCTHAGPCPMLSGERDWCHERRPWLPPPMLRQLASSTGLRRRDLRFSYLALGAPAAPPLPGREQASRVVSSPLGGKGRLELMLCDGAGQRRMVLLKRHISPANRAFTRLDRGHLAWVQGGAKKGQEFRLDHESVVRGEDPVEAEDS